MWNKEKHTKNGIPSTTHLGNQAKKCKHQQANAFHTCWWKKVSTANASTSKPILYIQFAYGTKTNIYNVQWVLLQYYYQFIMQMHTCSISKWHNVNPTVDHPESDSHASSITRWVVHIQCMRANQELNFKFPILNTFEPPDDRAWCWPMWQMEMNLSKSVAGLWNGGVAVFSFLFLFGMRGT